MNDREIPLSPDSSRPGWWHNIAFRQIRAAAAGFELFEDELAESEWNSARLFEIRKRRRDALAQRLGCWTADLANRPIMDKRVLRNDPESLLTGLIDPRDEIVVRTSGTTGIPTVIRHSDDYLVERAAQRLRLYRSYRVPAYPRVLQVSAKPGRPVLAYGPPAGAGAGTILSFNVAGLDDENRSHVDRTVAEFAPHLLAGQSMELLAYADEVSAGRMAPTSADTALSQGDTLLNSTRRSIQEILGLVLFDTYGLQEFGQIAFECPDIQGNYHINAEAVDLRTDQTSVIHITSLINRAMSLVNYRTDDEGLLGSSHCACGRALPVLQQLQGRQRPLIRGRDGRGRQATNLQTTVSDLLGEVWQLQQPAPGRVIIRAPRDLEHRDLTGLRKAEAAYDVEIMVEQHDVADLLDKSGKFVRYLRGTQGD